jgi:hypothetical protein
MTQASSAGTLGSTHIHDRATGSVVRYSAVLGARVGSVSAIIR